MSDVKNDDAEPRANRPQAEVVSVAPNPDFTGAYLVVIRCPHGCDGSPRCLGYGPEHHHGLPSAEDAGSEQWRDPHCPVMDGRPEYFFVVTAEMVAMADREGRWTA